MSLACRDVEIQQIAKSIEELSQIFKELAVLVIDQGTILDRIDFNMEQVVGRSPSSRHSNGLNPFMVG
jgi:syntaxin 16